MSKSIDPKDTMKLVIEKANPNVTRFGQLKNGRMFFWQDCLWIKVDDKNAIAATQSGGFNNVQFVDDDSVVRRVLSVALTLED